MELDPDRLRDLGAQASTLSFAAREWIDFLPDTIKTCYLQEFAGQIVALSDEVRLEMSNLAELADQKATQMEEYANKGYTSVDTSAAYGDLAALLGNSIGETGLVGDNAVWAVYDNLPAFDADGDGYVSQQEIDAVAKSGTGEAKAAALYLKSNPALMTNLQAQSNAVTGEAHPKNGLPVVTREGVAAFLAQNEVLRKAADPKVFQAMAGAGSDGDNKSLSLADLEAVMADPNASADAKAVAKYFLDHPERFYVINGVNGGPQGRVSPDQGKVSADDLVASAIGTQAFAADAEGAKAFALSLGQYATWTDISGRKKGINMRNVSDDGLKALAAAALSASPKLSDQVNVVACLPESPGGVRNSLFTFYYSRLATAMNKVANPGAGTTDFGTKGHTGANWMMHAVPASYSVGAAIRGEVSKAGIQATWADRQWAADGNQFIFGDIAVRYAQFVDAFPPGEPITKEAIDKFFTKTDHPMPAAFGKQKVPLFGEGQKQLRAGFLHTLAAMASKNPKERQVEMMKANIAIATHEQAGAQNALRRLVELEREDGPRVVAGGGGLDRTEATKLIFYDMPGTGTKLDVTKDLPPNPNPVNNQVIGLSLKDDLNPDGIDSVWVGFNLVSEGVEFGDVRLPEIAGAETLNPTSEAGTFPTNPADWGDDPTKTATTDWSDPKQRMWYIANLFQQSHTDPKLFTVMNEVAKGTQPKGPDWKTTDTAGTVDFIGGIVDA